MQEIRLTGVLRSLPTTMVPPSSSSLPPPTLGSTVASQQRMENTVACLPIVYGSVAFALQSSSKKVAASAAVGDSTHEWTLYLRGPNHEDLSLCIQKAVFHLHPSFAQPVRELTSAPYEVTEQGWGEFEAQIRIYWKDSNEASTLVTHGIKLYPPPPPPGVPIPEITEDPVIAESYDEVVFTNPSESFFDALRQIPEAPAVESSKHQRHLQAYSDADDFMALLEAKKFLKNELESVKERLVLVNNELEHADDALRATQEKAKAAAAAAQSQRKSGGAASAGAPKNPVGRPSAAKKSKTS